MPLLNIDWRVLLTDATGAAVGTSGNPLFTAAAAAPGTTNVQGVQAAGAAITENPVLIAGQNAGNVKLWALTSGGLGMIAGALSNNNAAPGTDFIEVLPAIASAAVPTFTEGNSVMLSSDLKGNQRVLSGGYTTVVNTTLTRPNNTTQYTANTALANATAAAVEITFSNCARYNGGSGFIHAAWLLDEADQTTKASLELWLFDTALGTVINDDANWAPTNADLAHLVGIINLGATPFVGNNGAGASGNVVYSAPGVNLPFVCAAGTTSLHGQLVVRNTYTPVANEVFIIRLEIGQD